MAVVALAVARIVSFEVAQSLGLAALQVLHAQRDNEVPVDNTDNCLAIDTHIEVQVHIVAHTVDSYKTKNFQLFRNNKIHIEREIISYCLNRLPVVDVDTDVVDIQLDN